MVTTLVCCKFSTCSVLYRHGVFININGSKLFKFYVFPMLCSLSIIDNIYMLYRLHAFTLWLNFIHIQAAKQTTYTVINIQNKCSFAFFFGMRVKFRKRYFKCRNWFNDNSISITLRLKVYGIWKELGFKIMKKVWVFFLGGGGGQ